MSEAEAIGLDPTPEEPVLGLPADDAAPQPEHDAGDFEARLRNDPEFALAEFKKQQSRADRAVNDLKSRGEKWKDLEPWIDNLGGAQAVLHHLSRLGAISGNAQMRAIVEEFERTGRVPGAGATDSHTDTTEEYLDPVEREVKALKQKIADLEGGFGRTQADAHKDRIRGDIAAVLKDHDYLSDEDKTFVLQKLETNIRKWDESDQGRSFLANLSRDDLDTFVASAVFKDRDRRKALASRILQQGADKRSAAATSVAAPVTTNGREVSSKAMSALDAVRASMRELGVTDLSVLRRG